MADQSAEKRPDGRGEKAGTTGDRAFRTMADAAREKGVAYQTVWRAVSRGQLPAERVGRAVLLPAEAVEAWEPCYDRVPRRFRGQPRMPRQRATPPPPRKALVADDDDGIREMLSLTIREEGVPVLAVSDGEQAVQAARQDGFTHIFLDVRMPQRNGLSALPAIRQSCPDSVIAFVTAYPADLDAVRSPESWPIVVIPKPFDIKQIVDVLRMQVQASPSKKRRRQAARA